MNISVYVPNIIGDTLIIKINWVPSILFAKSGKPRQKSHFLSLVLIRLLAQLQISIVA